MQRPVARRLRFGDVVPHADDRPRLPQTAAHGIDVGQAWEQRTDTTDVLHLSDLHLRLSCELVDDRRPPLQPLRDLYPLANASVLALDVVAKVRSYVGEWTSVQRPPPPNSIEGGNDLRHIESPGDARVVAVSRCFGQTQKHSTCPVDLALGEGRTNCGCRRVSFLCTHIRSVRPACDGIAASPAFRQRRHSAAQTSLNRPSGFWCQRDRVVHAAIIAVLPAGTASATVIA